MQFGMVLQKGEDGKASKIKTREGASVMLKDLLDEAQRRALAQFAEREAQQATKVHVDEQKKVETAEIMGISAIKYYDLK